MSEKKCNNYCELMYCDENKFGVFCKKNKLKCSYILEQQLQTVKEELKYLKSTKYKTGLLNKLHQQNKQMREAIELGLAWVHNHKQCSLDNKCNYGEKELQNLEDILTQQALKGVE